ncbi:Endonuclease YncB, thermonuclease family [Saccharopolyspora kobensis]|uniref:Endonuclease YncB, thermonuclease family n=1 Tax=Saccharopolyspora kobensis TaxID=146035 RepID=A0A1H5X769_9PSEU|nr:nuclease [Saccharopolyspora kobensis]SEG07562.1 Endonuclease YncB, thermonuclease family [Saccharopolyspora kobensis]SFE46609.1 Endonuclease YncB, thermonuclease family [Saccharopolyspora kobensis]
MTFTLIKGAFRITGSSPDGDSVRFYPTDPDTFRKAGLSVRLNARGGVQLRLEGIDALETHYRPQARGSELWHQPAELADAASSALLQHLGFTSVERDDDGRVTASTPEEVSGHILTRFADTYGRAVAFAFPGQRPGRSTDGADVRLDPDGLPNSANHALLEAGLVYPTFYSKLFVDLRETMAEVAVAAREARRGVWAEDTTLEGLRLRSREQLREEVVLLPKLFRRLVDYLELEESGGVSLSGFSRYLDTRDDRLFTVPTGHATELETLVEVRRQTLRLTVEPERIVFTEA